MSNDNTKRAPHTMRLIPGEPVEEFGGMTPEQFGRLAEQLEDILLTTFRNCGGALSMYSHLACRMFLMGEDVVGAKHADEMMETFIAAMKDEMDLQRKRFAALQERAGNKVN